MDTNTKLAILKNQLGGGKIWRAAHDNIVLFNRRHNMYYHIGLSLDWSILFYCPETGYCYLRCNTMLEIECPSLELIASPIGGESTHLYKLLILECDGLIPEVNELPSQYNMLYICNIPNCGQVTNVLSDLEEYSDWCRHHSTTEEPCTLIRANEYDHLLINPTSWLKQCKHNQAVIQTFTIGDNPRNFSFHITEISGPKLFFPPPHYGCFKCRLCEDLRQKTSGTILLSYNLSHAFARL